MKLIILKKNIPSVPPRKEASFPSIALTKPKLTPTDTIRALLKQAPDGKYTNTFEVITSVEILRLAYETIKSKPGNMVRGTSKETLDRISLQWFDDTSRRLRNESYNIKPNRRIYIPKSNGKHRPLGIASPRDKIIQQAMNMVMEVVLEPQFLDTSHGFRPKRGCHTALRELRTWRGVPWIIEGDIKSFFDSIDHHILEQLLEKHFRERHLFNLYWKFVKAGYIEFENKKRKYITSTKGVPQGGILSPLLSNLMLHELDVFMRKITEERNLISRNEKPTLNNPAYYKINNTLREARKRKDRTEVKAALRVRRRTRVRIPNPLHTQIKYVRYADDWLVGVWGNKSYAKQLKSDIALFLQSLKLTLSPEKTLITNTRLEKVKFLGVHIQRVAPKNGPLLKPTLSGQIWMTAPLQILVNRLREKGFWRPGPNGPIPKGIDNFVALPVKDLILRFRTILAGLLNFYSFSDNIYSLRYIYHILRFSLLRTICKKFDIGIRECLRRYGPSVSLTIHKWNGKTVKLTFDCPPLRRSPMSFLGLSPEGDSLQVKWKVSTLTALGQCCANCGDTLHIEMHHLKHLRTLNLKLDSFGKMMARINRKQVPLCKPCHRRVHQGTSAGMSLRHFNYIKWEGTPKWS
jgi:group II intron reverse transcriptase/maturase